MDQASLAGLRVARPLADFLAAEALPGTGLTAEQFWTGFAGLVAGFAPRNRALSPAATNCRPRSTHGTSRSVAGALMPRPIAASSRRSVTCCRRRRHSR